MTIGCLLLAFYLVRLTGQDGQAIIIDSAQVATIREPPAMAKRFHKDVRCLVHLTDGHSIAVIEPCAVVHELLEGEPD